MKTILSAPKISHFSKLTIPPQQTVTLKNGIILHLIKAGESPANRITLMWNYGANRCHNAIAYKLVPSVLKQGTSTMTGAEIVDKIDFLGAFLNHTAETAWTSYDILSLNQFTPALLKILEDIVLNPTFPEERFDALKRKFLANYDVLHARTSYIANEKLDNLIAGSEHPYYLKHTRKDIESLTLDDVKRAWEQGIFKSEIHIFAAGNINESVYEALMDFACAIRPHLTETTFPTVVQFKPAPPGLHFLEMPNSSQSSIAMAIPAIRRTDPDFIPLRIATVALGGYFGSRLMTSIREEMGMTYGISASLAATFEGGNLTVHADCDPSYVDSVVKQISNEMQKMADKPMSDVELRRLKSYYMTTLASVLETFKSVGDYYQSMYTVGTTPDYFHAQQDILKSLTPDDIRAMARKYFLYDKAITVVAGKK